MNKLFMCIGLLCSLNAVAEAPLAKCVDLSGTYLLPSSVEDKISHINNYLTIDQTQCLGMDLYISSGGMIPVGPPIVFGKDDGDEIFTIVGDAIVDKATGGDYLIFYSNKHGQCRTTQFSMALDANRNMIAKAQRIYGCDDKYSGVTSELYPRQ